ncbi:MAG TPA: sigma-70 family RNA polymerase sigma factor [Candidatus Eisenbacteria bacterium]|nr:sigma-70 family RNA polymerase sigma factor [Candidatus Eisenbacteria bacterium]
MAGENREPPKGFGVGRRPMRLNELRAPTEIESRTRAATERALVADARAGDRKAMDTLATRLADAAYRFGRGFCGDPHDAEDVTQEVLTALVTSLPRFRGEASLSTWAWIVARRACARRRRDVRRIAPLETSGNGKVREHADPAAGPDRHAERRELASALDRAIASLPSGQREVLLLRDVEGLPASRVARALGLEVRAVKSRLHRARLALRAALAPHAPGAEPSRRRGCPDTARLVSRFLEGELRGDLCRHLEAHASECPDCTRECAEMRELLGSCRRWGKAPAPRALRQRLRRMMRAKELR